MHFDCIHGVVLVYIELCVFAGQIHRSGFGLKSGNGLIHFSLFLMEMTDSDFGKFRVWTASWNGLSTKYESPMYYLQN